MHIVDLHDKAFWYQFQPSPKITFSAFSPTVFFFLYHLVPFLDLFGVGRLQVAGVLKPAAFLKRVLKKYLLRLVDID